MDKRYQVFVSSTFRDLEQERQEVMHALLELDCIPSGMELFPATNEAQWNLIKKVIDDCDYYVLIIGGRYGSIGPDGVGYTEMEYRYAIQSGKPTISFLHKNPGAISVDNSESTDEGKRKLKEFRCLVEDAKLCKYWGNAQDLGSVVSRSLTQLIKNTPAVGWVRADKLAGNEATIELFQLRKQVQELEAQLTIANNTAPKDSEHLAQGDDQYLVHYSFTASSADIYDTQTRTGEFFVRWDTLFSSVAPIMLNYVSEDDMSDALSRLCTEKGYPISSLLSDLRFYTLSGFTIKPEDFHVIKIQLRALGLIVQKNASKAGARDSQAYWTLTAYGDSVMSKLLAIPRNVPNSNED